MTNFQKQQLNQLRLLVEEAEISLKNSPPDKIYRRLNDFIRAKEQYVAYRRTIEEE